MLTDKTSSHFFYQEISIPNKASNNLLRIWNDENSKDKVIDASVQYLQEWEGTGKTGEFDQDIKRELLIISSMSDFPKKLNLDIVSYGIPDIEEYKFILDEENIEYQDKFIEIYRNNIKEFSFNNFFGHDFSILINIKDIFNYLLQTKFFLKAKEIKEKLVFNPKPIRILLKDENSSFFKETPRVLFFKKHMILCAAGWSRRVDEHLTKSARVGYKKYTNSDLNGLPENWNLFADVEILSQVETSEQLNVLVPYSDGSVLELTGGLKLNQSIYHSQFPPLLQISSEEDRVHINYGEEKFDGLENKYFVSKEINGIHEEVIEKSFSMQLKSLKITLSERGKKSREKIIHFRSADDPKYINFSNIQLTYIPSNENLGWSLSTHKSKDNDINSVEGMLIEGEFINNKLYEVPKISFTKNRLDEEYTEIKENNFGKYIDLKASSETCILRGYHIFSYPSYNQFEKQKKIDVKEGKCKECGLQFYKLKNKRNKLSPKSENKSKLSLSLPQIEFEKIDIDYGLFDALCYLGEGSWQTFLNLTNHFNDSVFFPKNFLRDLIHLGHIDVEYNKNCQPLSWKVNPPTLVKLEDNSYFLTGFRNQNMIQELKDLCKRLSCEFIIKNNENCVSSYFVRNINKQDFLAHLNNIQDSHGRSVQLVDNISIKLIKMLPSISETLMFSNSIYIETTDQLEFFSAAKGKWIKAENLNSKGSYRLKLYGQRYFIKMEDGSLKETFHEIAKIYSCILEGVRIHSYDEVTKEFSCFLASQPPVLYGRALVSNTGLLPEKRENLLIYKNVDPNIGNLLINLLYHRG